MTYEHGIITKPDDRARNAEVRLLAARALAVLASNRTPRPSRLIERLRKLTDAFIAEDSETGMDALALVMQDGISASDVIDFIIPETSRLLGERWFADEISFADVSIGSARLQESVRALRQRDTADFRNRAAGKVLMVIPRPEHHTLGLFIAADQLRRLGLEVDFAMGPHPRQLAEMLRRDRYRMVAITASGRRTLASVKELVETIRSAVSRFTPVVVGGPITEALFDVRAITGADYVTADIRDAAERCGILERSPVSRLAEDGGHRVAEGDRL
ncbi:hypothetical protein HKCCE3408_02705 [Rhodobacterales bacterium HKCCE3408]|nr:hypothetical protein [Rhodobacterales bacterium HKCCE3408]